LASSCGTRCSRRATRKKGVVYIPAGEVHVEENASEADDLVVLVTRNCAESVVHYVN
jgi:uncharacterized RmlC-like cupin family protein